VEAGCTVRRPQECERVTARLIVRRVRDLAEPAVVGDQGEPFPRRRYHPFFADDPAAMLKAGGGSPRRCQAMSRLPPSTPMAWPLM
jgi:hypothetical protein